MKSNLTRFQADLKRLRTALDLEDAIEKAELWAPGDSEPLTIEGGLLVDIKFAAGLSGDLKKLFYGGVVVQLYGSFEQFAEALVVDAVGRIYGACDAYSHVPKQILAQHTQLTLEVLQAITMKRYHGDLQERDLVEGLHHAAIGAVPVRLNVGVFGRHSANFKWDVLLGLFTRVGIPLGEIAEDAAFASTMDQRFPDAGIFSILDDLSHRRNQISHGWETDDLLSIDLMRDYIEAMDALASAMIRVTTDHVAGFVTPLVGQALGKPDVLYNGTIACYYSLPVAVSVGGVLAVTNEHGVQIGTILGIEKNHVAFEEAGVGEEVGISVSRPMSSAAVVTLLPASYEYLLE